MTSQSSVPFLNIAPNATNVHFHFNSQPFTTSSQNVRPHLPMVISNLNSSAPESSLFEEITLQIQEQNANQARQERSNVSHILRLFRNMLSDTTEASTPTPRTTSQTASQTAPQTTSPQFHQVLSRSVNMRNMLQRLQQQSGQQDSPIAVSFEVVSSS